jgi:AraC family transcriptional regulator, ethanolamine operon transcriptional activator
MGIGRSTIAAGPAASVPLARPLRNTQLFSFDPEAMTLALQDGQLEHVQLQAGRFQGRVAHSTSDSCRVDWGDYNLAVLARGDIAGDMVSLGLLVMGDGDWRVHGQAMDSGDLIAYPEKGELLIALPPRAQWVSLQVPRHRLESMELPGIRRMHEAPLRVRGGVNGGLRRVLADLAPVLAAQPAPTFLHEGDVARAHEDLFIAVLGEMARRGDAAEASKSLNARERWRVIRRAEEFIESSDDLAVRIDDLCAAAGTSLSRLERAFREVFGMSPRRLLAMRRLAGVRRELLLGDANVTVTDVAMRWGFYHLGRFSQEYRALYAERPSDTMRRARSVGRSLWPARGPAIPQLKPWTPRGAHDEKALLRG